MELEEIEFNFMLKSLQMNFKNAIEDKIEELVRRDLDELVKEVSADIIKSWELSFQKNGNDFGVVQEFNVMFAKRVIKTVQVETQSINIFTKDKE